MYSPRIQQVSAAKCQTIYAPVPPKENRAKTVDFIQTHRIVSSVTADHVRDIRLLDHTTPPNQGGKKTPKGIRKSNTSVSFFIGGEQSSSRQSTATSAKTGSARGNSGGSGLITAEVKFASPSTRQKGRMMSGGFALMRDRSNNNNNNAIDSDSVLPPMSSSSAPPPPTTPGRASPCANVISPGPFYSPVRGTIRLSAHYRQVFTPTHVRASRFAAQIAGTTEANEHNSNNYTLPSNQEPRSSSPLVENVIVSNSPLNEQAPELCLTVTGLADSLPPVAASSSIETTIAAAENNATKSSHPNGEQSEVENDTIVSSTADTHELPQAPPPPPLRLPNRQKLENNTRVVINNAFLPRDNTGGWMFRQKWLRLFARNGANGLAYCYSAKLQNSYS